MLPPDIHNIMSVLLVAVHPSLFTCHVTVTLCRGLPPVPSSGQSHNFTASVLSAILMFVVDKPLLMYAMPEDLLLQALRAK